MASQLSSLTLGEPPAWFLPPITPHLSPTTLKYKVAGRQVAQWAVQTSSWWEQPIIQTENQDYILGRRTILRESRSKVPRRALAMYPSARGAFWRADFSLPTLVLRLFPCYLGWGGDVVFFPEHMSRVRRTVQGSQVENAWATGAHLLPPLGDYQGVSVSHS